MNETPKKPRGFAAMTPEQRKAAIEKGKAVRLANREARLKAKEETPVVEKLNDAFDRKLEHFAYTMDPREVAVWEQDETVSPLHVPKEIKDRYPNLSWRFVSERNLKTKGVGYHGWQLFRDGSYPEGIKRGNDLQLAAMPKELAESYRKSVQDRSTEAVASLSEGQLAKMEQAIVDMHDPEASILAPGEKMKSGRSVGEGIRVGARPVFGRGGNYQRGLSRSEMREAVIRSREERAKNKKYVFMGGK